MKGHTLNGRGGDLVNQEGSKKGGHNKERNTSKEKYGNELKELTYDTRKFVSDCRIRLVWTT